MCAGHKMGRAQLPAMTAMRPWKPLTCLKALTLKVIPCLPKLESDKGWLMICIWQHHQGGCVLCRL